MIKRFIVITSIFPPSEAVQRFARFDRWRLVVVGDRKTPRGWTCPGVEFMSLARQAHLDYKLAELLPRDHYARKMLGYLRAVGQGAGIIVDTDDDNVPRRNWGFPDFEGRYRVSPADRGFVNVYRCYSHQHIWPRGLPLECILRPAALLDEQEFDQRTVRVGIWQGLVDGEPDVDAVYRLTSNAPCRFEAGVPVVLGRGTLCPFNSQNTAFARELFPLMYLPAHVTFRFTDILRGYVAQPIIWRCGYHLGFTAATVVQRRNPHDAMDDFASEIPFYLHAEKIVETVEAAISARATITDNLVLAYEGLVRKGIVPRREMAVLQAWIADVQRARAGAP